MNTSAKDAIGRFNDINPLSQSPCCDSYMHRPVDGTPADPWFCAECGLTYFTDSAVEWDKAKAKDIRKTFMFRFEGDQTVYIADYVVLNPYSTLIDAHNAETGERVELNPAENTTVGIASFVWSEE